MWPVFFLLPGAKAGTAGPLTSYAQQLSNNGTQVGFAILGFGVAFGTVLIALGKEEGRQKIAGCLFGGICLACVGSVVNMLK